METNCSMPTLEQLRKTFKELDSIVMPVLLLCHPRTLREIQRVCSPVYVANAAEINKVTLLGFKIMPDPASPPGVISVQMSDGSWRSVKVGNG